jgi:hypothetical protein
MYQPTGLTITDRRVRRADKVKLRAKATRQTGAGTHPRPETTEEAPGPGPERGLEENTVVVTDRQGVALTRAGRHAANPFDAVTTT